MNYDNALDKASMEEEETPEVSVWPAVADAPHAVLPLILQATQPPVVASRCGPGRPVTLHVWHLALGVLWCVLQGWSGQRAVWRRLCARPLGPFAPVSVVDQTVYTRLHEQGASTMRALFLQVSQWLNTWLTPYQEDTLASFASQVYAIDECILDPIKRVIRSLRQVAVGDRALLAGRLSAVFDVRRHLWVRLEILPEAAANCKVFARSLICGLPPGSLLLFDLGYYAFEWFDDLTAQGFFWISRWRQKSSFVVQAVLIDLPDYREQLVQLGAYRSDWASYTVRMIEYQARGVWFRYLTNVLDPQVLPGWQVAQLYARRWDIEMAFRVLKDYLGLNVLWGASWQIIQVQVWACAILAQALHALQVRLAAEMQVGVFEVSLPILLEQVSQRVAEGAPCRLSDLLQHFRQRGRQIGLIRPSSRLVPVVPQIPQSWYRPPPEDLVSQRSPRYGHRPAGNRKRQPPNPGVT